MDAALVGDPNNEELVKLKSDLLVSLICSIIFVVKLLMFTMYYPNWYIYSLCRIMRYNVICIKKMAIENTIFALTLPY